MVIVLHGSQRISQSAQFADLFRWRHDMLVVRRQRALPGMSGMEEDYDTPEAVYFVETSPKQNIVGHVRMNPTATQSHLADHFPHLCQCGASLRGSDIFEWTLYLVEPRRKTRQARYITWAKLMCETLVWAQAHGGL